MGEVLQSLGANCLKENTLPTMEFELGGLEFFAESGKNFHFCLGGGFKQFLFSSLFGEDSNFD